ncbi:MAG: SMC-Scp complex subunit ScpB [Opitutaceae bacterium]|nr:SMC-Scp complex subunit ScpB [Opitutaceae bacterium]
MAFNLKKVLKALLFSSNQPLAINDIQAAFTRFHEQTELPPATDAVPDGTAPEAGAVVPPVEESPEIIVEVPSDPELYQDVPSLVTTTEIREAMDAISLELKAANEGLLLIEGANGYRLVTHPHYARWVRILRDDPPPLKLSQSSLETLAIVAYRQPVTRTELETIRGVSAEAGINKLLERELIYIVGRADLPGRPIQYGTTDQFLEFIGIKSLDELPASDVLSNRQIDDWLQTAASATKPPTDAEMGLPLEQGEGVTPNLETVTVEHEHAPVEGSEPAPADDKTT